jgi:hypothetical protein
MNLKGFEHILDGSFKCGFEIECCVPRLKDKAFIKDVKSLSEKIQFTYDGSLRPNGWTKTNKQAHAFVVGDIGHELVTPVFKSEDGILFLNELFKIVQTHGYTNSSCGLHANFSPTDKKNHEKINPFWLAEQKLWQEIKRTFARDKNKYCQDIKFRKDIRKNPVKILQEPISKDRHNNGVFWDKWEGCEASIAYKHRNAISLWHHAQRLQNNQIFGKKQLVKAHWHYSNINFTNYQPTYTSDSRIEIRSAGGEDYEKKIDLIAEYADKSVGLFKESFTKKLEKP